MDDINENRHPLVSVIIPTLNREKYIRQCVESALSQNYPNIEVIVVDNGSTDNTPEILASFGSKIKCLKEEKRGQSAARNKGLRTAQGEFIAFLDDDDFYLPEKISLSVRKLLKDRSISLVYTDYVMIDSEGSPIKTVKTNHPQPEELLRTFVKGLLCVVPSITLMRRECLEKSGYFNETMLNCHEDTELWFRMLKAGCHFGHIPKPLTAYRWHAGNTSRLKDNREPIRVCWNKICSSAIEYFTPQELFGNIAKNNSWGKRVQKEYNKLADTYCFEYLPLSARAAAKKSLEIGRRPFFFLSFLANAPSIFSILYNILENTVKLTLASINPKLTRNSADKYRGKLNTLFFKLRYRLCKIFSIPSMD